MYDQLPYYEDGREEPHPVKYFADREILAVAASHHGIPNFSQCLLDVIT